MDTLLRITRWLPRRLAANALAVGLAFTLAGAGTPAHAGRTCENKPMDAVALAQGLALAEKVARQLDESGADVLVVARVGQDLSKHGLRYSHLGLAYREAGGWRVVHKLNRCSTAQAAVYRQGLAQFFLDDLHAYEAGVMPLAKALQPRLRAVLADNRQSAQLHTAAYSMVAYPWSTRYQQSNQWAAETLALAAEPMVHNREQAQAWLKFKGYQPTTLHLSTFTRLGARMTQAHIAFDDHPDARRYAGRIDTVTVDSVFDWLERSQFGGPLMGVR